MQINRLERLLEFIKNEPDDPFLKYALATEYLRIGQTDKALDYFEDLVNNHRDYSGTYYHLGKLYEALGRREDAIKTYETGMKVTREQRNNHAYSELQGVYDELMDED
ncbi:MAG TPA: tetratricopeptide repeat protein [Mucilaginibacter sp.]|nr:tetratricopeptide repeat protein [Mucilaginibacter sp.]